MRRKFGNGVIFRQPGIEKGQGIHEYAREKNAKMECMEK